MSKIPVRILPKAVDADIPIGYSSPVGNVARKEALARSTKCRR